MSIKTSLALAAFALSALNAYACQAKLPEGLSGDAVGSNLGSNGILMSITQVKSQQPIKEILDRTEIVWKEAHFDVKRSTAAGWEIVSGLRDKCLVTLQLSNHNGAFGYFAVGRPGSAPKVTLQSQGLDLPDAARVTSSITSDDDGRKGLTTSMTSSRSLDELRNFFMDQLREKKWGDVRSHTVAGVRSGVASLLVTAQRGRKQVEIIMWKERETQIVMTLSEAL
jgi:hypothetical protein